MHMKPHWRDEQDGMKDINNYSPEPDDGWGLDNTRYNSPYEGIDECD